MGGAGKKLPGHGAHSKSNSPPAQSADGGHGRPPHPLRLRPGQVFWPRAKRTHRRSLMLLSAGTGTSVVARRLDGAGEQVRVSAARLLARGEDGQGRYYSFVKWSPRRYETWACVVSVEGEQATLVLPEWHPALPVRISARLLPASCRRAQEWLSVKADLSQPSAGRLNVEAIGPCEDPGLGARHPIAHASPLPVGARALPELGSGCGDIVLEEPNLDLDRSPKLVVFVRERPAGLSHDARIYLPHPSEPQLAGYASVVGIEISPNGASLRCDPVIHPLDCEIALEGRRETSRWRWRWWPRALEGRIDQAELDRHSYDPEDHSPAYVWTLRPALVERFED